MELETLLEAIGSQEPSDFGEICNALGDDRPEKGDKEGWTEFFALIRKAEAGGLIETTRGQTGQFESAILTEAGVNKLRR